MNVQILKVSNRSRRYKRDGGSSLDRAYVRAYVDGYLVVVIERKGWDCSCLDEECGHVDALAAVLHPDILSVLDGDETDQ